MSADVGDQAAYSEVAGLSEPAASLTVFSDLIRSIALSMFEDGVDQGTLWAAVAAENQRGCWIMTYGFQFYTEDGKFTRWLALNLHVLTDLLLWGVKGGFQTANLLHSQVVTMLRLLRLCMD